MDYEILLKQIQELTRKTKELQDSQKKLYGTIIKESENGDLKALQKDLISYGDKLRLLTDANSALQELVSSFDSEAYLRDGDFTTQMLEYCQQMGVDVFGTSPTFDMFPFKVRINSSEQSPYLNNKKTNCLRPRKFVEQIVTAQNKLSKTGFNAVKFANELAAIYDLLILKLKKKPEADVPIKEYYKVIASTSQIRKLYDENSFAYALSRLEEENNRNHIVIEDGRQIQIGSSHEVRKGFRILDSNGKEAFVYQIRFYKA